MSEKQKRIWKVSLILTAVYLGMKYLVPIFIPFLIAVVISLVILPAVNWSHRVLHMNRSISAACLMLAVGTIFAGVAWFAVRQLFFQMEDLICYFECYGEDIKNNFSDVCCEIEAVIGIDAIKIEKNVTDNISLFFESVKVEKMPQLMGSSFLAVKNIVKVTAVIVVIFISVILLIRDSERILIQCRNHEGCGVLYGIVERIITAAGTYLKTQLIIMGLVSTLCILTFWYLNNPYALLAGILIGLFDAFPFIGTGTILVPWAVINLFSGNYKEAVFLLGLFLTCSLLREFLEPRLIGKKLGIYPIAVLISIYAGIKVYGISGIVFGPMSVLIVVELIKLTGTNESKQADLDKTGKIQ